MDFTGARELLEYFGIQGFWSFAAMIAICFVLGTAATILVKMIPSGVLLNHKRKATAKRNKKFMDYHRFKAQLEAKVSETLGIYRRTLGCDRVTVWLYHNGVHSINERLSFEYQSCHYQDVSSGFAGTLSKATSIATGRTPEITSHIFASYQPLSSARCESDAVGLLFHIERVRY